MKTFCNSALLVMALGLILTYSNCGPPVVEPSIEEKQLEKLKGTWVVGSGSSVTRGSGTGSDDVTSDYTNFKLTFSGTHGGTLSYSVEGRPQISPWPENGNWAYGANPETTIVRDPANSNEDVDMIYTVSAVDAASRSLELTFQFTGTGYENSRVKNVTGTWVFSLKAQ